jgi:hypothetical protein
MFVKVDLKAFGDIAERGRFMSVSVIETEYASDYDDLAICELIFHETNVYAGAFYTDLKKVMSEFRTHTALSVNDEITIARNNQINRYKCVDFGFELIESVNGLVVA